MPKLSVTLITRNEAANIEAAISSIAWADEIVVVDSGSSDDTVAIARRHTDRVIERAWDGYGVQKNYAAAAARHDWILSIDADERVTPQLASEIRAVLAGEPRHAGYRVPRVAYHLGRWLRSTDWYPDYQLRLYDRRAARWKETAVHESVRADGPVGVLRNELQHLPYRDISDQLETIDRYTTLWAAEKRKEGRHTNGLELVATPCFAFLRNYLLRGGIRDGTPGLIISLMNSYYVFLKFAKLWELQHRARTGGPEP